MSRTVLHVRCVDSEKAAWIAAAGSVRGLSEWVRRTLNEAVALEAAVGREPSYALTYASRVAAIEGGRGDLAAGFRGPVPRKGSARG